MPIKICTKKKKKGKKWGDTGKCYTGPDAQEKAERQAAAAHANGYVGENEDLEGEIGRYLNELENDPEIFDKEEFFKENPPTSEDHPVPWETED